MQYAHHILGEVEEKNDTQVRKDQNITTKLRAKPKNNAQIHQMESLEC